jgi:acyl-CoA thioesterase-1
VGTRRSTRGRPVVLRILIFLLLVPTGCHLFKASSDVAFLGDSITEGWIYPQVNLGVYGNTTAQMVARFPAQVHGNHFRLVVILGGTNDVLLGRDPAETIHNLQVIATLAEQAGAQPVLCEIPPIFHGLNPGDRTNYSDRVRALNRQIAQLAAAHKWSLIDYYHPILGHPSYSSDGVHLKRRGYAVMEWTFLRQAPPS